MKKTAESILIIVVTGIVLFFALSKSENTSLIINDAPETIITDSLVAYQLENTQCYDSNKYFVIEQPALQNPGSNFLVKYKKTTDEYFPCEYSVKYGDFELRNPGGADYFTALTNHFLVTDSGTAVNNRGITLYDLNSRQEVFHDQYSSGDPVITETSISYWKNTGETVTKDNCVESADSQRVAKNTIVTHITLDLITMIKKDHNEKRCVYQE